MQYGYFDLANKEYVITRPDTPSAWANYLGSPEYGAIISNNAGGYSFVKSGANGRITRYRFNSNMALAGADISICGITMPTTIGRHRGSQLESRWIPIKAPVGMVLPIP